jgi:ribose transport system permease protein
MQSNSSPRAWVEAFARNRTVVVYLVLAVFVALAAAINPAVVSFASLQTILQEVSFLGIVVLGQSVVMLSGGLDISVGNVMFFVIVFGGNLIAMHPELFGLMVLFCLGVGGVVGLFNGVGVAKLKISPIVMTLATSSVLYGSIYVFGNGRITGAVHPALRTVGKMAFGNLMPLTGVIWLFLCLLVIVVSHATVFGRRIYASGNNPRAAWLAGVHTDRVLILSYVFCGFTASLAGLLFLGFLGSPTLRFTDIYTMGSISAAVIGGIEFFRGTGSVVGAIGGTLFVRFLFTFLLMIRVPEAGRMITEGAILILIVASHKLRGRHSS